MRKNITLLGCLMFLVSVSVFAASPREAMVVNAAWLAAHGGSSHVSARYEADDATSFVVVEQRESRP